MEKLLIVDDEPKIREVIREYAEFNGYECDEAEDGMTAVGLCKLNDYDLIILDIMMPKLDGYSTCKEIKKLQDLPIIMLSARGEEYDKLFGFELGIDDHDAPREARAAPRRVAVAELHRVGRRHGRPVGDGLARGGRRAKGAQSRRLAGAVAPDRPGGE